jgi:hypothetical protein
MTQRASQLAIAYSPVWLTQPAWDDPVDAADLTKAFPATSRNFLDLQDTTEDIFNCTDEDLLLELLTGREARLNVDMDFDPDVAAGIIAAAYGVAAAPTGGTDEVQSETVTATGGTRTLTVQTGANSQTTTAIAYNANAAAIQAALEALSNVGVGDIVVTGTGPYVYTFSGTAFSKQDVNLISVNAFALTGGTSTFSTTTPGVGLLHNITRLATFSLPLLTFYIGFRGSSEQPVIYKNVVVDNFRVRSASREKVTMNFGLIGSGELGQATGFTMPDCQDLLPIRFGDCKASIAGTDYIAANLMREFEYYFQNDVAVKFDGQGIYATRHERADKRPSQFSFFVLGEPNDSLWDLAALRQNFSVFQQWGPDGRNVKCTAPQALVKLAPSPVRFGGDPPESELNVIGRPRKVSGDATTPTTVTARIATTATLLTADT